MEKSIRISGLKKHFGDVKAVDGISFDVEKGSLFSFLGLNGAGKSTAINIICTSLEKDEGKVEIEGYDLDENPQKIRENIGVVFQNSVLDKRLSIYDNLTTRASLYGLYGAAWKGRLEEISTLLNLKELIKRPYGKLSGGQRRRVDIARAIIHKPKILILDEPTTGLDPATRKTVWTVIEDLQKEEGMTVFLTTHYMEEAANSDMVVIIDTGKIVAQGTPVELKNKYSGDYIKLYSNKNKEIETAIKDREYVFSNNCYKIKVKDSIEAKDFLIDNKDIIGEFEIVKGNMDDVFLNVTGKKITEG